MNTRITTHYLWFLWVLVTEYWVLLFSVRAPVHQSTASTTH